MLSIPLDTESKIPLYTQIYQYIRSEILNGSLSEQKKLPSTRTLSSLLNVSRTTVDMAYCQLVDEGYVSVFPKKGYFVNEISSLSQLSLPKPATKKKETVVEKKSFSYDFSPFSIDLEHFPYATWQQLSRRCLKADKKLFLLGDAMGDFSLREEIASYLHQSRSVKCSPEQIVVGAGVDYLLQLLAGILGKNRSLAMENPSYIRAFRIFQGLGYQVTPIPLDKEGLDVTKLSTSLCDTVYVTPSHQYPMGVIMPINRRLELLAWAEEKTGRYIIEDDHDSEFRYRGKPIPSLQGIDSKEKVIYLGTFSRAIAPAIRVGYMVLPPKLLEEYHKKCYYYSSTVSRIDQAILTAFLKEGYFERHLNRMRKLYKEKHDTMTELLEQSHLPLSIQGENAGLHLVVSMKDTENTKGAENEKRLIASAAAKGIKVYGLLEHFIERPKDYTPTLLLGYANLSLEEIRSGLTLLFS
jgi:GntR family transcriptional regulator/MocR family aminotransferase